SDSAPSTVQPVQNPEPERRRPTLRRWPAALLTPRRTLGHLGRELSSAANLLFQLRSTHRFLFPPPGDQFPEPVTASQLQLFRVQPLNPDQKRHRPPLPSDH